MDRKRKTLVFIPQSYTIKVFCDFSEIKDKVFRDVSLSWNNSLATTEKDTVDDLTYFKSYIYQGGELEELKVKAGKEKTKSFNGITNWGAIRTKYFICALIPESPQGIRSASLA